MENKVVNPEGIHVHLNDVEIALFDDPCVDESVVIMRESETSGQELVAYVVPSGPFSPEQLEARLRALLPTAMLPGIYVPISAVPLTSEGHVDEEALARLEVIDTELLQKWEEQLQSLPEIDQVAVVVQEHTESLPPLHLSDLLPGWKGASTSDAASPGPDPSSPAAAQEGLRHQAPAISHGGPLLEEAGVPLTLTAALQRAAVSSPERGVVYVESDDSESFQSYPALLEEAQQVLAGLRGLGLKPEDKVIFQFERNRDFITAFWGCVLGGFVPVPLSIAPTYRELNAVVTKLHNAWLMLDQPVILTGKTLAPEVGYLSDLLDLEGFRVETIDGLLESVPDQVWHESQPGDLALLLLTSGSTGFPKGVMQNHRSLLSRSAGTSALNSFHEQDVSLNWMPLDHVGGIVMFHIRDVYLCCQQIHAPIQTVLQNPTKWLDWIQDYKCTITWAPNFAYTLVNDQADKISQSHLDLSTMRFILNGGEAIVAKTARKFLELLRPHGLSPAAMHPAWGMSETCSGVTYSDSFSLASTTDDDPFVEVGAPIPGFSMRIVDEQNQVVDEGAIGGLQVQGSPVTTGYYKNAELNEEVFTRDGWFVTGDLGFLRDGQLTITGRDKEVIIINGINYHSHEIEAVAEQIGEVESSYTAACAVRDPGTDTDKLAIFFHPSSSEDTRLVGLLNEIRGKVVERMGVNPAYLIPVEKEDIPKTSIGKIQRSQLSQRYQVGEFDPILKRIDILSGNANTLPDWFYQKTWRPKEATTLTPEVLPGSYLVFLDRMGLGESLGEELGRLDRPYVGVEAAPEFVKLSATRYRINPKDPEHYKRLLESLAEDGFRVDQLLHLWGYDEFAGEVSSLEALEQAQDQGVYSLLFLTQALDEVQGLEHPVRLYVITSHSQPTSSADKIAYEKSTIMGLLKTIPLELPGLRCCHLDLEVDPVDVNAGHVLRELRVLKGEAEIAYRNGRRLASYLSKVDLLQQETQDIPIKQGGVYLLTGGLGGIGTHLAQFLIKEYQANLIIVGRTALPDRTDWSAHLGEDTVVAKRIDSYLQIEATGGEFIYESVDVCDLASLQKVVARAESQWNERLSGVIHLAGEGNLEHHWTVVDEHLLTVETPQTFDWMFRPKVYGTWALSQLLNDNPHAIFVTFSSVNGLFGGATFSAYSAANSFLDTYGVYQRNHAHSRTYCLSWSQWDDLGMSEGNPTYARNAARSMGYYVISKEQGLKSLVAGLCRDQGHLIVGLDGSNRNIRRYMVADFLQAQKIAAYFTVKSGETPVSELKQLVVSDRFGVPSSCDFVPVAEMPLTDKGEVDREQLATAGADPSQATTAQVGPQTELERRVAGIWKEVLGVPSVGIYDNFMALGGDSLRATQVVSRLRGAFSVEMLLRHVFEHPTIAKLAEAVEELIIEKLESLSDSEAQRLMEKLSADDD